MEGVTFAMRDPETGYPLVDAIHVLKQTGLCSSNSQAIRLIKQGGAYIGEERTKIMRTDEKILITPGLLVWSGKHNVVRVTASSG